VPCFHPLRGYYSKYVNPTGKRSIVFSIRESEGQQVELACGQCIGCRLERSRNWAIRCVHESKLYENNCFITLTYDAQHLPKSRSLQKSHFQKFMKRLRKKYSPTKIRFFHCGEYGEKFHRPHYHACLFNHDFPDKKHWKTQNNQKYYTSDSLNSLWGQGFTTIGAVTFESAAYVARYITKKVTGHQAPEHYQDIDEETGEVFDIQPEYVTMSRRPGIGKHYYEKHKKDWFSRDFLISRGTEVSIPKFYNGQFEIEHPEEYEEIKARRHELGLKLAPDNTFERRRAKETCKKQSFKKLIRSYEND